VNDVERDWEPVVYAPGDEREILELFNREFGQQRSLAHWLWKFRNPWGGAHHVLARRRTDRRVVGTHMLMPFPLNLNGKQLAGGHSLDLVVDRSHRGQGIFGRTGELSMQVASRAGVEAVVAFPNRSSYPGFVRTLGWRRITSLDRFQFGLDRSKKLRSRPLAALVSPPLAWLGSMRVSRLLRRYPGAGLRFELTREVPEEHDALWQQLSGLEVLSLWKDRRYLQWRYEQHPDQAWHFASLWSGTELRALAVLGVVKKTLWIAELFARDRSLDAARALVAKILETGLHWGVADVAFLGHDSGWFEAALVGFSKRPEMDVVFVGRGFDDELTRMMELPGTWSLTFGDSDFV
jgi:predicted N-acetyltransferase YhbS